MRRKNIDFTYFESALPNAGYGAAASTDRLL
jgi:hypothetical protein